MTDQSPAREPLVRQADREAAAARLDRQAVGFAVHPSRQGRAEGLREAADMASAAGMDQTDVDAIRARITTPAGDA